MLKYKIMKGALYVALEGELDHATAPILRKGLDELISNLSFEKVILDMGGLSFMDSTGVGLIMGRYRELKKNNKSLLIRAPGKAVDKVLEVSGIYTIIQKI